MDANLEVALFASAFHLRQNSQLLGEHLFYYHNFTGNPRTHGPWLGVQIPPGPPTPLISRIPKCAGGPGQRSILPDVIHEDLVVSVHPHRNNNPAPKRA